jgi:Nucleoside-diphosphate-sugar pyrophosphorylase involved in lipopolysaccharide biosynthesis/translation initiation factor 2B, gamma/epsilon subunits (eIF-2Bgamma/eIF-2Bepsilon)
MGRPIYGCVLDGYWQDIGNLEQYRQANFDALDEKVRLDIPGIRIRGNIWVGEGVDLHDLDAIEGRCTSATTAASRRTRPSARTPCSRRA